MQKVRGPLSARLERSNTHYCAKDLKVVGGTLVLHNGETYVVKITKSDGTPTNKDVRQSLAVAEFAKSCLRYRRITFSDLSKHTFIYGSSETRWDKKDLEIISFQKKVEKTPKKRRHSFRVKSVQFGKKPKSFEVKEGLDRLCELTEKLAKHPNAHLKIDNGAFQLTTKRFLKISSNDKEKIFLAFIASLKHHLDVASHTIQRSFLVHKQFLDFSILEDRFSLLFRNLESSAWMKEIAKQLATAKGEIILLNIKLVNLNPFKNKKLMIDSLITKNDKELRANFLRGSVWVGISSEDVLTRFLRHLGSQNRKPNLVSVVLMMTYYQEWVSLFGINGVPRDQKEAQIAQKLLEAIQKYLKKSKSSERMSQILGELEKMTDRLSNPRAKGHNPHITSPGSCLLDCCSHFVKLYGGELKPKEYKSLVKVCAFDLTLEVSKRFSKISLSEFDRLAWSKKEAREKTSPNLMGCIQFSNQMSFLVSNQIVREKSSAESRAKVVEFWVDVAHTCFSSKDYYSAMAILSGLTLIAVGRLHLTKAALSSKHKGLLELLECALNPERSYRNYRRIVQDCREDQYIPLLNVTFSDLTAIVSGNCSDTKTGAPNYRKIMLISYSLQGFERTQKKLQTFSNFKTNLHQMIQSEKYDREKAYEISISLEPRKMTKKS